MNTHLLLILLVAKGDHRFQNADEAKRRAFFTERTFENDWFNREHDLNITKSDLIELLRIATKNQLFQFEGKLYEQVDGVAMGSPLGPLMANAFMCEIEKQLEIENKLPIFYKRFVDDTLSAMPDPEAASEFLETLNKSHPSIDFTMELEENGSLPFLGMDVIRNGFHLDTTARSTESRRTKGSCYTTKVTLTPDTNGHC